MTMMKHRRLPDCWETDWAF